MFHAIRTILLMRKWKSIDICHFQNLRNRTVLWELYIRLWWWWWWSWLFYWKVRKKKKRNSLESYGVSAEQHLIVTKHSWLRQSRERLQNNWTTKVRDFRDRKDLLESTPLWVNTVDLGLRSRRVYEQWNTSWSTHSPSRRLEKEGR